jgi:hypothetical protein
MTGRCRGVKDERISEHERFVVCHNPEAAQRDATIREQMLTGLRERINDNDRLPERQRAGRRGGLHQARA